MKLALLKSCSSYYHGFFLPLPFLRIINFVLLRSLLLEIFFLFFFSFELISTCGLESNSLSSSDLPFCFFQLLSQNRNKWNKSSLSSAYSRHCPASFHFHYVFYSVIVFLLLLSLFSTFSCILSFQVNVDICLQGTTLTHLTGIFFLKK